MPDYKPLDIVDIMNPSRVDEATRYYNDPFGFTKERFSGLFSKPKEEEQKTPPLSEILRQTQGDGGSSQDQPMNPHVTAFLDAETPEARGERLQRDWFGLAPIGAFMLGGTGGLLEWNSRQPMTAASLAGRASVLDATPSWLRELMPEIKGPRSAHNARFGASGVNTNGITYAELDRIAQTYGVPAMSQQAQMLAEQEAGMFSGNESYSWGGGDNSNRSDPGAVGSIADTRND